MTSLHQDGANGGKGLYIYVKNRKTAINPPRMATAAAITLIICKKMPVRSCAISVRSPAIAASFLERADSFSAFIVSIFASTISLRDSISRLRLSSLLDIALYHRDDTKRARITESFPFYKLDSAISKQPTTFSMTLNGFARVTESSAIHPHHTRR